MRLPAILIAGWLMMPSIGMSRPLEQTAASAGTGLFLSSDNEGFITRRLSAEYWRNPTEALPGLGLRYRASQFEQIGWTRNARQVLLLAKGDLKMQGSNWQAETGVLEQGGRQLFSLDASLHAPLSRLTSVEAFINRDYVETRAALEQGIHAMFAGASLEQQLHPHLSVVGLAGVQDFSDGNLRKHVRLRVIWQPDLDIGFTVQYRYRMFNSDSNDIRRTYFNPERYQENMLLAGWRKRGEGWQSLLLAGVGRQHIDSSVSTPTALLEASLEKKMTRNQNLALRAGLSRSASFGGPDYRYRYLQASWMVGF